MSEEKERLFKTTYNFLPDKGKKMYGQIKNPREAISNWKPAEVNSENAEKEKVKKLIGLTASLPLTTVTSQDLNKRNNKDVLYVDENNVARKQTIANVQKDENGLNKDILKATSVKVTENKLITVTKPNFRPLKYIENTNNISKQKAEINSTSRQQLEKILEEKERLFKTTCHFLPDKGQKIQEQIKNLREAISNWKPVEVNPEKEKVAKFNNLTASLPFTTITSQDFNTRYDRDVLYVGENNAARRQKIITVTLDAIKLLHESMKSKPNITDEEDVPKGLVVSLMEHQRQGLKWAMWRETQYPPGGIIADEMGLGKTVLMLAVVVKKKLLENGCSPKLELKEKLLPTSCTLIVCPTSLMHHWESEFKNRCQPNLMSVLIYHGPRKITSVSKLALFDIIITSYETLRGEVPSNEEKNVVNYKSPLLCMIFTRIVLDEGHVIKNPKTKVNQAVCRLHSVNRWVLTGTPIHNKLKDMYSLLKFLRFSPFDEEAVWRHWVDNGTAAGQTRLKSIMDALLLRRLKNQTGVNGQPLVNLPAKENLDLQLILSSQERKIFDELLKVSRVAFENFIEKKTDDFRNAIFNQINSENKINNLILKAVVKLLPENGGMATILVLLLRLQQCCCHLSLLKLKLDSEEIDEVDDLTKHFDNLNLTKAKTSGSMSEKDVVNEIEQSCMYRELDKAFASTKVAALLEKLHICLLSGKCIIVSQWSSLLDVIACHLLEAKISFCEISGRIPPNERGKIIENFNCSALPKVMLLSLKAGGVGLNLTGARYLFLMDIHWNPALEAQAYDRIHRVGQKYDVKIFRFVCENTIEQRIIKLQIKKLELAKSVLEGKKSTKSGLTLEDLRMLFGV